MPETSRQSPLQRILIIVSGVAFLGTMAIPMFGMFEGKSNPSQTASTGSPAAKSPEAQIEEIEKGYEKVLEREPNNVTALQGLAQARLKRGDLKGGLVPLKKLQAMFPQEKELAKLVVAIETQLKNPGAPPPSARPSEKTPQK